MQESSKSHHLLIILQGSSILSMVSASCWLKLKGHLSNLILSPPLLILFSLGLSSSQWPSLLFLLL